MKSGPSRLGLPGSFLWCLSSFIGLLFVTPTYAEKRVARSYDGINLHYEVRGNGVPLFLIPGGPGRCAASLSFTHAFLEGTYSLVFVDTRGRGNSDAPANPMDYTLANDVADVEAIRADLGAEKIVVYGHSYGSMVAMSYATKHPDHTLALITTGGTPGAKAWQEHNIDVVKLILRNQYPDRWKRIVELHNEGVLTGSDEVSSLLEDIEFYVHNPETPWRFFPQFPK